MKGLSHTTLAKTSSRANVTPSALKTKPGKSTEDAKCAAEREKVRIALDAVKKQYAADEAKIAELAAKLKKGEEFLATVVNKEDGGLAADEEEGTDDALIDLVREFDAKL